MFPAALLLRSRPVSLAAAILLTTGLIWFGPYFLPKAARASGGPSLKMVTFNIWGDNATLDKVEVWLRQTNADVVLLQETPAVYNKQGVAALRDLYPYQVMQDWTWGNLVLSRHPIERSEPFLPLQDNSWPQQKITITAPNIPNGRVVVYNNHFPLPLRPEPRLTLWPNQPFFVSMPFAFDDRQRNREIAGAVKLLEEERDPFIFGGDFNMNATVPTYDLIAQYARDSYSEAGMGLGLSWPIARIADLPAFVPPLIRIDYVWHSPHFCATRAELGPELGSDHLPVVVNLQWCS